MQASIIKRIVRYIFRFVPKSTLKNSNWEWLKKYPAIEPSNSILKKWNFSHWEEYQLWIIKHSIQSIDEWQSIRENYLKLINPPRISIVTPVFNTEPHILYECILSVRMQAYPFWQWILVDDASTRTDTKSMLASGVCADPRIKIIFSTNSLGISGATNQAIAHATGDYIVFLDHDDRLSLDALGIIAAEIIKKPELDIIYSDRDMISENGYRFLHLFKPDWSPETLMSGNYVFHLMTYQSKFLKKLNGLRSEYDGSQDYDLILRAAELSPIVCHIPKVLYHWRQHNFSVALNANAKDYAFAAGIKALNETLNRRKINGCAREIPDFWRGCYELQLPLPNQKEIQIVTFNNQELNLNYAQIITDAVSKATAPYILILIQSIRPETSDTILRLVAWIKNFDSVSFATAKIVNDDETLDYVGMAYNRDTTLMHYYRGFHHTEAGYFGVSQIIRNISAPHPFCVAFTRKIWGKLNGFDTQLSGPLALLDFALRAQNIEERSIIVPQCIFRQSGKPFAEPLESIEAKYFKQKWSEHFLNGDPYYNINLADHSHDMGLDI